MNWEAIGAIGELLGAAGVIITLIYLAIQIRQNTASQKHESISESQGQFSQLHQSLAKDPELAKLWMDGLDDYLSLSTYDRVRFSFLQGEFINLLMARKAAVDQRLVSSEDYEYWGRWVGSLINTPGGIQQWETQQSQYTPEIRAELKRFMAAEPSFFEVRPEFALKK
jgi:hypothetical protein